MRKILLFMACLLIALSLPFGGIAETAAIRDGAAILSAGTQTDATKLSRIVEEKTGLHMAVDIRHFLGGAEAGAYARRLLNELPDPDDSLLLLVVVGEESYALAAGTQADKLLGKDIRDTLLSKNFRVAFLDRQYDQAVSSFMLSAAEELGKTTGERLDLRGLFGHTVPQATQAPLENFSVTNILDLILGEPVTPSADASVKQARAEREDQGLGLGSIIIIGLVLSSIFGKKNRNRRRIGPFGWILGVFGLSKLFGWRR